MVGQLGPRREPPRVSEGQATEPTSPMAGVRPPNDTYVAPPTPPSPPAANAPSNLLGETVVPAAMAGAGLAAGAYLLYAGDSIPATATALAGLGAAWVARALAQRYNAPKSTGPSLKEAVEQPHAGAAFANTEAMLSHFRTALQETSNFGVGDALTFRGEIPIEKEGMILERARRPLASSAAVQDANKRLFQAALSLGRSDIPPSTLQRVATDMMTTQNGVCTTFAALAAHILTRAGQETKIPIEIMSRRNDSGSAHASTHLFCVAGRRPGSAIEDPSSWGKDARIVDLWLGALGNDMVYTPDEYQRLGWLKNTQQVYSNQASG